MDERVVVDLYGGNLGVILPLLKTANLKARQGKARQGKAVLFITQAFHVTRVYTLSVRIMLCACLISISMTQDELHDSASSCSS